MHMSFRSSVCSVKSALELTIFIFFAQIKLSGISQVCLRFLSSLIYLTSSLSRSLKYFVLLREEGTNFLLRILNVSP